MHLKQFTEYYKHLDEMITGSTKEDRAECARLLALNVAHYKAKYGGLPLEKHQAMFPFNDIDEDMAKRSTRQTLARCRRFPYRSQKAGIMRSVLLVMGIATVSVLTPPASAETNEVDITCDESPIQVEFKTIADDDRHCRKWIVPGRAGRYADGEVFHRFAQFAGGFIAIYYQKWEGQEVVIKAHNVKKWLESHFETIRMSASNWGPTTRVKSGGKTFRTRKFVLRSDQTCVGFLQATGAREERFGAEALTGFFCETGQEYSKEFIAAFLSQIKITRLSGVRAPEDRSTAFDGGMEESVQELNKNLPMMIGEDARLDSISISQTTKDYNLTMTMLNMPPSDIETIKSVFGGDAIDNIFRPLLVNIFCDSKEWSALFDEGYEINVVIHDQTSKIVSEVMFVYH